MITIKDIDKACSLVLAKISKPNMFILIRSNKMFKSKRVRELEEVAMQRQEEIEFLKQKLKMKNNKIEYIQKLIDATPEECAYDPYGIYIP